MPASYRIDSNTGIVFSHASGHLTNEDAYNHRDDLNKDARFKPSFNQLFDLRDVESIEITEEGVRALAERIPFGRGSRRAFVIASDEAFGMVLLYNLLTLRHGHDLLVFKDMDLARESLSL